MRNFLRRWLGITSIQNKVDDHELKLNILSEEVLIQRVGQAFEDLISGKFDEDRTRIFFSRGPDSMRNKFEESIRRVIKLYSKDDLRDILNKLSEPESFIDSIVDRVNKKQLK